MAPIRVGLIGLGPTGSVNYKPGEWGVQHMRAILNSPHYELVAVCNSTVESAKRSIAAHQLPSTVKASGSAEDIARDPDVDLVAVSVYIGKHYDLVKPALEQGKKVLVEFPVTPDVKKTEELAALAKEKGVDTIVGAQGRAALVVRKLKELVETKAIGDVVYSSFSAQILISVAASWLKSQVGFLDLDGEVSRINIALGHPLDGFVHVLGGFQSLQTVSKTQVKTTNLVDEDGKVVERDYNITSPDTMLLQGVLESGAVASFNLRTAPSGADDVSFRWTIMGTEGEIVLSGGPGFFQLGFANPKILLKKFGNEAEEVSVPVEDEEFYSDVPATGLNILRLYEAYAKGEEDGYSTLEQTLVTEKILEEIKKNAVWAP